MTAPGDLFMDGASREMPQRILLADVRSDMLTIFGEPHRTPATTLPVATARRVERSGQPRLPVTRRGSATGVAVTAALAGLLAGMAMIGAPQLIERMTGSAPAIRQAAALTVSESPFEKPVVAADEPATKKPVKPIEPPRKAAQAKAECEGDRLERVWCMRHDILEADRRLRRAYAAAIHEGVERRFLVAHQRQWTRLRSRASRDPDGVLEGYGELAAALERLSVNGRRADRIS